MRGKRQTKIDGEKDEMNVEYVGTKIDDRR